MSRFTECMPLLLEFEGGWSDNPKDPGGATMQGITLATYRAWRLEHGLTAPTKADLKAIPSMDVNQIYASKYWLRISGDRLWRGLDRVVFDFAVNSGPARAARVLQTMIGTAADGYIGPATLSMVRAVVNDPFERNRMVKDYCTERLDFLTSLQTWDAFGKGWTARVNKVQAAALADIGG